MDDENTLFYKLLITLNMKRILSLPLMALLLSGMLTTGCQSIQSNKNYTQRGSKLWEQDLFVGTTHNPCPTKEHHSNQFQAIKDHPLEWNHLVLYWLGWTGLNVTSDIVAGKSMLIKKKGKRWSKSNQDMLDRVIDGANDSLLLPFNYTSKEKPESCTCKSCGRGLLNTLGGTIGFCWNWLTGYTCFMCRNKKDDPKGLPDIDYGNLNDSIWCWWRGTKNKMD